MRLSTFFRFDELGTNYQKEFLAAVTTFSSMAYVLIINPLILSSAGIDLGASLTATIIVTFLGTILMALLTNLPLALAPGMGVSAYLAFSVVLGQGISWQEGVAAIFTSAIILLLLNITGLRQKLLFSLPFVLVRAVSSGVGLFLIFVALKALNVVTKEPSDLFIEYGTLFSYESLLSLLGFAAILFFLKRGFSSAFLIGIGFLWILSLILGLTTYQGIISAPPSLLPSLAKFDFSAIISFRFWRVTFALLLVVIFDSNLALLALKHLLPDNLVEKAGHRAHYPDAIGTLVASMLGCGSLAIHLESASGIHAGGRSGFTALIVSIVFLFCLFFYPIISSMPSFAAAPVLFFIGFMMLQQLKHIDFTDFTQAIPVVLTMVVMPLTFSIYLGIATGFITYSVMRIVSLDFRGLSKIVLTMSILFVFHLLLTYLS